MWHGQAEYWWSHPERKFMDEVIAQLGDGVGASDCISMLLTDNRKLLEERVDSETLNIFLDGIRERGPDASFMEFLKSTASCQGAQVIPNQELVLKMILGSYIHILFGGHRTTTT